MSELIIEVKEWEPFDSDSGLIKQAVIRKTEGGPRKYHSVIIWTVTNHAHSQHGKVFIVEPRRNRSLEERLARKVYDSIEEAKPDAKAMFDEHMELVKSGEINWWSRRRRNV
jgi:hypothetical protein